MKHLVISIVCWAFCQSPNLSCSLHPLFSFNKSQVSTLILRDKLMPSPTIIYSKGLGEYKVE